MSRIVLYFCIGIWPIAMLVSELSISAGAKIIHIENRRDYETLDQFFRMGILEEEYGYVLIGLKPISTRNFYGLDTFPIAADLQYTEKELINVLLVREAIPIWNRLCLGQNHFVLKTVPLGNPESVVGGWEIQFINISQLQKVIEKNIDLFRYILGPTTTTDQLVKRIAYSKEQLDDILQHDLVLVGIVLGFGSYNSLVGGRLETIQALSMSTDCAPFSSKGALLMQHKGEDQYYGSYYLDYAGGDDSLFKEHLTIPLQPTAGFINVIHEQTILEAMNDPLPVSLQKKPGFVFGAFKGGCSNQPFFKCLQQVQTQIHSLLEKKKFLESVLEKIGKKKPLITCDASIVSKSTLPFFRGSIKTEEWSYILQQALNHFEHQEGKSAFIDAFCKPSACSRRAPQMMGASLATLEGLKKARHNLAIANAHFERLSSDSSLQMIIPKQLYFKIINTGSEKQLQESDRVRVGYIIENGEGKILFANCDIWLYLTQIIPGFAHGIQGMHVGEERKIFIHPSLAYGALTTLPPCSELIITVHLLDFHKASNVLPSLTPLNLDWIQNYAFYHTIETSIAQKPRFVGSFYRDLFEKMGDPNLEVASIITTLDLLRN